MNNSAGSGETDGINRQHVAVLALLLVLSGAVYAVLVGLTPPEVQETESFRLMLGGDIYVGDRILPRMQQQGVDAFTGNVQSITKQADLHLANLESPVTRKRTTAVKKQYLLRSNPEGTRRVLSRLNVDGVSLANNHVLDYEPRGLLHTMRNLNKFGVQFTGAGANRSWASRPTFFKRNNRTIGFLGFSNTYPESFWAKSDKPGSAYGAPDLIERRVRETADEADVTVVSFHWGSELDTRPKRYQKRLARLAVKSGADVVFGHHPHSIQPFERYQDGVIFYSLGNYFFTTLSDDVEYGLLADLTFENNSLEDVRFHVLNINNYQVNYSPEIVLSFKNGRRLARFFDRPNFGTVAFLPR